MKTNLLNPHKTLNKVLLNTKILRAEMDNFKAQMINLLDAINEKESEEFHKNLVISFLKKTFYDPLYFVNTKGRNDLVIHNGKDAKTTVGVIIEAKSPINKPEMITAENLNGKALQELVLYYLRERITHKNTDLKQLVVTNIYEWFIFDAHIFNKLFAEDKKFVAKFIDFEEKRASGKTTDFFYNDIAKPHIEKIKAELQYTYFDIRDYDKPLRNEDKEDDNKLVALYKLLSPEHLMKLPFANDSNTLDKAFYSELLHIIGLTEVKDGGKKIIVRHEKKNRQSGSLLENTITQLDSIDVISHLKNPKDYGETHDEKLFNVALELCITWVNRILFLKLLEAQLKTYHKGDENYLFLNSKIIKDYDELNRLFFQVLARKPELRNQDVATLFANVPYLNSSLFEPTDLEREAFVISTLEDNKLLNLLSTTVITDNIGKKMTGSLNSLNYFLSFLDAYNFASDGDNAIVEDNKTLINAAVLGLIFEKINGYKDGSFFTPSFITMYMCKETIRRAVVQKFSHLKPKGGTIETYEDVKAYCHHFYKKEDKIEYNKLINSLKICDPAVGSGHFLVSALNEIIAIKNDLGILMDRNYYALKIDVEIVNDELIVIDENGQKFQYDPKIKESQQIQETLFHEKQTIIENCLFGVDINPNSVKICQLRLWIELLKNAYYHPNTNQLETLPNIDINIKCGNSLISRFRLDADLTKALSDSKWTIETYKIAVATYQNATSKEQKREMIKLINDIKSNFSAVFYTTFKENEVLAGYRGQLTNMITANIDLFGAKMSKEKVEIEVKRLTQLVSQQEQVVLDRINNKIYDNAFEWRFEFPQVLNNDGVFMGFDIVIGNPPYLVVKGGRYNNGGYSNDAITYIRRNYKTGEQQINTYPLFIELSKFITTTNGLNSMIVPNTFLANEYSFELRKFILNNFEVLEIFNSGSVFEDASVETLVITSSKKIVNKKTKIIHNNSKYEINLLENALYTDDGKFLILLKPEIALIIQKLNLNPKLKNFAKVWRGLTTGNDKKYLSLEKSENEHKPIITGSDIDRYGNLKTKKFVLYKPIELDRPRVERIFTLNEKLVSKFVGDKLCFTLDLEKSYVLNSACITESLTNEVSIRYILAILNSKLLNYYFTNVFTDYRDTFPIMKSGNIENLPFMKISKTAQQPFIKIVDKILTLKKANPQADTLALEQEIDTMVYELYGLTDEEIAIVEGS